MATDLGAALAAEGGEVHIAAPFSGPPNTSPTLRWCRLQLPPAGASRSEILTIGEAIRGIDPNAHFLAVVPPDWASPLLSWLGPRSLSGLLLGVETASWGVHEALTRLRRLPGHPSQIRIGIFLVGVQGAASDLSPLQQLEQAASRQLDIPVEKLGAVVRDRASYRALLLEVPVLEIDPHASSSRSLHRLAQRVLGRGAPTTPAPVG
jgi:hypothetical protein